eukprot:UN11460
MMSWMDFDGNTYFPENPHHFVHRRKRRFLVNF